MKIIVTGGAGFIGSNFIFHMLEAHPEDRIICIDKLTYAGNLSTLASVMAARSFASSSIASSTRGFFLSVNMAGNCSSFSKSSGEYNNAVFTTSAMPLLYSCGGRDSMNAGHTWIFCAGKNEPIMFLYVSKSHPVFPPTAASTMESGLPRVIVSPRDADFSAAPEKVTAAIVVPLTVGTGTRATLQFYYANARRITNTQMSIADGFGQLLSTQMAASELESQTKLATSMQLKALQNQINPHFLFNTLNTIAALIRTDPMRARSLLREFATFYRTSLKDPDEQGLILLSKEIEQTVRYFTFEEARFGTDRVALVLGESEDVEDIAVPAFIIQPLVENAVRHALPAEGKLTIRIEAELVDVPLMRQDSRMGEAKPVAGKTRTALVIRVIDDGMGMSEEACRNIMHPESSTGAGIAVKNVADRIKGYFGPESSMQVESALGEGTTVTLTLFLGEG